MSVRETCSCKKYETEGHYSNYRLRKCVRTDNQNRYGASRLIQTLLSKANIYKLTGSVSEEICVWRPANVKKFIWIILAPDGAGFWGASALGEQS